MNEYLKKLQAQSKDLSSVDDLFTKLDGKQTVQRDSDLFYYPERDQAGNGFAIIRFLPPPENESEAIVKRYSHGFKGPGGWFIELSRTTFPGERDPVSEYNSQLWNAGNQQQAREQRRKLEYICNVLVLKDPVHPENEGKVFPFKFGAKIFEKIKAKMRPDNDFEERLPVFSLWEGANFKLKVKDVEGYANYDGSEFESPSALYGGKEKQLAELISSIPSLQKWVDPSIFKSYDELKKELARAMGWNNQSDSNDDQESVPVVNKTKSTHVKPSSSADDDDESFFDNLKKELS